MADAVSWALLLPFAAFIAGFLAVVCLKVGRALFSKNLLYVIVGSFVLSVFFFFVSKVGFALSDFLFLFLAVFLLVLLIVFNKELLEALTEQKVLQESLVALYVFAIILPRLGGPAMMEGTLGFMLVPLFFFNALVLWVSFADRKHGPAVKFFVYIWFLIIKAFFALFYLDGSGLLKAFSVADSFSLFDAFIFGTISVDFFVTALNLMMFLPGKHEPSDEYARRMREEVALMESKFSDISVKKKAALAILLIQGGALVANFFLQIVPPLPMVSFSLLVSSALSFSVFKKELDEDDSSSPPAAPVSPTPQVLN